MFGIMDVSGSMGEWEKEMAKRFFMLLYLFLKRNYKQVHIVWIRHHSTPKECDEEEFFYSQESGGTVVSPALKLMTDIIKERYPLSKFNIYGAQCSDGDDWQEDCPFAKNILEREILPISQYFAYIEVNREREENTHSDLWPHYEQLDMHKNFAMKQITDARDIFPVFVKLFEKKSK
jgi:uncharacterized sporulation protein YeaH/YhbH (DUF444 family)